MTDSNTTECSESGPNCSDQRFGAQNTPRHPLVIDRETKLARLATQADVHRMEAICAAYDAIIRDLRERIRMADYYAAQLENTYGR